MTWGLFLMASVSLFHAILKEPLRDAEDEEAFRIYEQQGPSGLGPRHAARLRFWTAYYAYRGHMGKMCDGAIFADGFDGPELSLMAREETANGVPRQIAQDGRWRIWNTDKSIRITQEDGKLLIKGKSTVPAGQDFNGLVGRVYADTDVILVADMKAVAPRHDLPGIHVGMVHLCGTAPDFFNELCFGTAKEGHTGWSHFWLAGHTLDQMPIHSEPALGDEREQFYSIRLEHEAKTQLSRAWLKVGDTWREVGTPYRVLMSSAKVELKVNVPTLDAEVECWFDNCRMYGRPQTHPLRVLLYSSPIGPVDATRARVSLFLDGAATPSVSGTPDEFGWVSLTLPADVVYPAAGRFQISSDDGVWEHEVKQAGVTGIYPGDTWVAQLNAFDMAGNGEWWAAMRKMMYDAIEKAGTEAQVEPPVKPEK